MISRLVLMKTILPQPRLIIAGATSWVSLIGAKVLISKTCRI